MTRYPEKNYIYIYRYRYIIILLMKLCKLMMRRHAVKILTVRYLCTNFNATCHDNVLIAMCRFFYSCSIAP